MVIPAQTRSPSNQLPANSPGDPVIPDGSAESRPASVADVLIRFLIRHGIRLCTYVPGAAIQPSINSAVASRELRAVMCGHEGAAVSMAEGYYRRDHQPAVIGATAGPGALNAINSVANAKIEQAALLIVTGQVPTRVDGRGAAQQYDVVAAYQHAVKKSIELKDPNRIEDALIDLLQVATAGRPGPVHLSLPMNLSTATVSVPQRNSAMLGAPQTIDSTHVAAAAARILRATSPVFLLGYGTKLARAGTRAAALAECCNAKIITTARAKGIVPEDSRLSHGVFGLGGTDKAMRALAQADLLIIVGSRCAEASTGAWHPALANVPKIQIDIERAALGRVYDLEFGIEGHAGVALDALATAISTHRHRSAANPGATSPLQQHGVSHA